MGVQEMLKREAELANELDELDEDLKEQREGEILYSLDFSDIDHLLRENPGGRKIEFPEGNFQVVDQEFPWDDWTHGDYSNLGDIVDEAEQRDEPVTVFNRTYGVNTLGEEAQRLLYPIGVRTVPGIGITFAEGEETDYPVGSEDAVEFDPEHTYQSSVVPAQFNAEWMPETFRESIGFYEDEGRDLVVPAIKLGSLNAIRNELEERGVEYKEATVGRTERSGEYRKEGPYPETFNK